jgi:hypothetical protein
MIRGADSDVWFAGWEGVSRFDGTGWHHYSMVEGERLEMWEEALGGAIALSLVRSPDQSVVAGSCGGIYRYEDGTWVESWPAEAEFVWRLCPWPLAIGPGEELWFGHFDGQANGFGLFHFDGSEWSRHEADAMTEYELVDGFLEPKNVTAGQFLSDNMVTSIALDPDNSLWSVSAGPSNALDYFNGQEWSTLSGDEYLKGEVLSVCEGPDGSLWFQTDQGFSHYDGRIWTTYSISDMDLDYGYFSSSTTGPDGDFWLGELGGLLRFDGKDLTYFTFPDEVMGGGIGLPAIDQDGAVWAPGHDGVLRFVPPES